MNQTKINVLELFFLAAIGTYFIIAIYGKDVRIWRTEQALLIVAEEYLNLAEKHNICLIDLERKESSRSRRGI